MDMFKHLLLPTDGSPLSEAAIKKGVQFAKGINARITGFYVMPELRAFTYRTEMPEEGEEEFAKGGRVDAGQFLAVIERAAKAAGVACDTDVATSGHPYEAIIKAAEEKSCDLIVMASHGRRGVQGALLGSETQKVLTHSKLPVLMYR